MEKTTTPLDPHATHGSIKCYRCQGYRHKSNTCPKRREVNICKRCDEEEVEQLDDEELEFNEEIYPDDGDHINYVTHRVYLTPKTDEELQRHNLFSIALNSISSQVL